MDRDRDRDRDRGRGRRNEVLPLYSIHQGVVSKTTDFGCFVDMRESNASGMVHISQLAETRVANVTDVVGEGDTVFVKVIEHRKDKNNEERIKLSLSMNKQDRSKTFNQYKNEASNSILHRDVLQFKTGASAKCAYSGQVYELIPDEEETAIAQPSERRMKGVRAASSEPVKPVGRGRGLIQPAWMTNPSAASAADEGGDKKHKKSKKSSKKHKKHHHSSKKKHKKRKRSGSSSSSDASHSKLAFDNIEQARELINSIMKKREKSSKSKKKHKH